MSSKPSASITLLTESQPPDAQPAEEFLRPGAPVTRRLTNNERSFTITFHATAIVLSFGTGRPVENVEDGALWVQIGLLIRQTPRKPDHSGSELISLDDMPVDVDIVVEYTAENPRICLQWNSHLMFIQYHH